MKLSNHYNVHLKLIGYCISIRLQERKKGEGGEREKRTEGRTEGKGGNE